MEEGFDWLLTCNYHNFAFHPGTGGIWSNLLKLWNVFKVSLVGYRRNKLLTEGSEPSLRDSRHVDGCSLSNRYRKRKKRLEGRRNKE